MTEKVKSKLPLWAKVLLIVGIIAEVGVRAAFVAVEVTMSPISYITFMIPSLFVTYPFYDEAGVWSGEGITIENLGKRIELEDGASYNGVGTIALDGVTYEIIFQLAEPQSCVFAYDKGTFHEWEGLDSDDGPTNDSLLWTFDVDRKSKKQVAITIVSDYVFEREGKTDHTGETFVLYRQ